MNAIHPGQLVVSVFGLSQRHKEVVWRPVFSLIVAFGMVLACAAILGFAVSVFGKVNLSLGQSHESVAYLPSQAISTQLTQGYLNLR